MMKRIAILGSTGSVGKNTLEVARALGGKVAVVGLSANRNVEELNRQIAEFRPLAVAIGDATLANRIKRSGQRLPTEVFSGSDGMTQLARMADADLIVNALVGAAGIRPTLAAIDEGKDVAIANKESLVAAGAIIVDRARRSGVSLIPVDSEHSAIHQCIRDEKQAAIRRIILTASGGPLVDMTQDEIGSVKASDALRHPTWAMGKKVTIDSATLLNKGFEVIEAHWLFGVDADQIEVAVERQSIVHSLVEFIDGSVMALLSLPDMRLPIQYALTFPERVDTSLPRLDLASLSTIAFEHPDLDRFPCLGLAYEAARMGGTAAAVLSAADEIAVDAFLREDIAFGDIHSILSRILSSHKAAPADSLDAIIAADRWAREQAEGIVTDISGRT